MTVDAAQVIAQREAVRLDAWRAVFEKTDRIISERPVGVQIVRANDIPNGMEEVAGWSDGEHIYLNGELALEMFATRDHVQSVLALKGLNYHELAHVLYTPRAADEVPRQVIKRVQDTGDSQWWYAFNALEDQRIETYFTATYGPSRRYFEATILQWIIKEGGAEAAILTHGRKYLSAKVRVTAAKAFKKRYGKDLYSRFQRVINEYLTVVYPTDSAKAMGLVFKFHALLKELSQHPNLPIPDNGMHQGGPNQQHRSNGADDGCVRKGRVAVRPGKEARENAADEIAKADKADEAEEAKQDQQGSNSDQGQPQEAGADQQVTDGESGNAEGKAGDGPATQAKSGEPSKGQGSAGSAGTDADADSDATEDGGYAAGTGAAPVVQGDADKTLGEILADLIDAAHDDMDDVEGDAKVQQDIAATLDAVRAIVNDGQIDASGVQMSKNRTVPASPDMVTASRKVQHVLSRIRSDLEPTWLRRQVKGRMDPRRAIFRQPNEIDIFTQWDEGSEDEGGVEAVVLLDVSGSMNHNAQEASVALWALKRAFDKLSIRTTVLAFNDGHQIVYKPSDKVGADVAVLSTSGGTNPTSALGQAALIFAKSAEPNKLLITLTDGQWMGSDNEIRKIMRNIHGNDVTTLILGIGGAIRYGKHDHKHGHDLRSLSDLPKVATKIVADLLVGHVHNTS